ncbi:ATP-dependent DNA helicase DinG [Stella humosa]|uniref:ATP-dependent DNA helicase DinG n=1 Tax=Stella humosa TaxID=94 RepID=A0A3N1KN65_9PROT|nr:ATP-dependent DNA helicase [Stella humosa]ROP83173.1 ATP-dependent DNA helicase DinG [Stella humosa]BBK30050.1 DNA helicase [Stella humosa]
MNESPVPAPLAPSLVVGLREAAWLPADGGGVEVLGLAAARARVEDAAPYVVHGRAAARRLGLDSFPCLDLLELYAFVRPATFCVPTPRGLAQALGFEPPDERTQAAELLPRLAERLLADLAEEGDADARAIARAMARGGWIWAPAVLAAFGETVDPQRATTAGLEVWRGLGEWSEHAPEPPSGSLPVAADEAEARLAELLGPGAERRPQQVEYAAAATAAFVPRERAGEPHVVLAEAGTGVGKTLGYLAPATLWAERNGGAVWVSTYTRNLQRQIDDELDRLHADPLLKARRVVVRKGRENYLCLLNFEEAVGAARGRPADAIPLGLMARWAAASRDGDMVGGDFPAWLAQLVGRGRTLGLTDRRGECVYSACPHYHKCFIERSVRRARRADIVVANHALVMVQAALGGMDDTLLPTRLVFDEGHHVFDAADGAFASHLSGQETSDLRRWLRGAEGGRSSRARGLRRRVEDLVTGDEVAERALEDILIAAASLPGEGWLPRLAGGKPEGPAEAFLTLVRQQVHARSPDRDASNYGKEAAVWPPVEGLLEVAAALEDALARLGRPMRTLVDRLKALRDDEAEEVDTATRLRLDAIIRGIARRADGEVAGWQKMLRDLARDTPVEFVDWLAVERFEGHDLDVGMYRHWIDPTVPFTEAVVKPAHGVVVTSATLTDGSGDPDADWSAAEERTGARHLPRPALHARVPSPFDYARQTRVLVVTDLRRDDVDQTAAAYRALFLASGGGALGLFTAVSRLRQVHHRIAPALDAAGLPLYAQHVDGLDTTTLVDIFRAEEESCLLGTDAVRDGVDVPGRSLRLIVFDRVPWPRPDILHKARRAAFGGAAYDERLTRFRLRQAFGRLVRRADDTGVFVLLDRAFPSRLHGAFPPGVTVVRMGLADAVQATRGFLMPPAHDQAGSAEQGQDHR